MDQRISFSLSLFFLPFIYSYVFALIRTPVVTYHDSVFFFSVAFSKLKTATLKNKHHATLIFRGDRLFRESQHVLTHKGISTE